MSADLELRVLLVALAVVNVGLTIYHATILRRARRFQADTERLHDEAQRLLGDARALAGEGHVVGSNGHRPREEAHP